MPKLGQISIQNKSNGVAIIDIEGVIGIPEWWQFDDPADRVSTFDKFTKKCNQIKDLKAKEIVVNIRSIGGDVSHALLIHDSLCSLDASITTVCFGFTASAATLIAQAGNKRQISSNALYLIHQCATVVRGNVNDMQNAIDDMKRVNDRIIDIYVNRSGKDADHFREIIDRKNGNGEWLSPDAAIEAGLCDEIVTLTGAVNVDPEIFVNLGYPEIPADKKIQTETENNQNLMTKIKNSLSSIWAFLAFPSDADEHEFTDADMEKINTELSARAQSIADLTSERDQLKNSVEEKDAEILTLTNKVEALEKKPGDKTDDVSTETDGNKKGCDMANVVKSATELINQIKNFA